MNPRRLYGFLLLIFCSTASFAQSRLVLHFDFDKYNITRTGKHLLDSILHLPDVKKHMVQLYGHTDAIGDDNYNDVLSVRRVNAAKNYLRTHGLPAANILIDTGLGKRQPLNNNADKLERKANRRVEIVVIPAPPTLMEKINDPSTTVGTELILQNLNFNGNRHVLMPHSWPVMLDLLNVMRKNPTLEIEIHGHVCCTGGKEGYDEDEKALILSTSRAFYVYKYLIDNGISKKRLSWKAFGNSKPLYREDTQEKRMLNRRVEIKIIKK